MELGSLLEQNREEILGRWFELIIRTYPPATSEVLAKQKDQFRNPAGHAITQSIEAIYSQLASTMERAELLRALDGIIRLRSVQDFSASDAVAFVFDLKPLVREVIRAQTRESEKWAVLADLESRIDRLALLAFEKYAECREELYKVRTNEIISRSSNLLGRVNVKPASSKHEGEPVDDEV
jgi:hypothetical protein